jgi:peptidoglycan/xylan/chitin deacetylase (PgdA/CDA1 family)
LAAGDRARPEASRRPDPRSLVIARSALRRVLLATALAALVAPLAAPLAGGAGWVTPARAVGPAAIDRAPTVVGHGLRRDPVVTLAAAAIDRAPTVIRHGPRTDRVVALTFDDGWNPTILRQIYRILVRERVPATFFVTGIYVQRAPDLWRQIAAAGFPLANHSYLHRDTRDLAPRAEARDLAETRDVVEAATGRAMIPFYRPPYGSRTAATDMVAAAAGFPYVVLWDTTAADTTRWQTVSAVVRNATAGRSGSIVLLHAGPAVTPRALPAIIAAYRARGFRFVTVPELIGTPSDGSLPVVVPAAPPGPAGLLPATSAGPSRSLDRTGGGSGSAPTGGPPAGSGRPAGSVPRWSAAAPREVGDVSPPAHPIATAAASPAARDAAWARGDEMPPTVAVFTVAILVMVLAGSVVAGRSRRPEDDADPG